MGGLTARFGMELGITLPLSPPLRNLNIFGNILKFLSSVNFEILINEMLIHNMVKSLS